MKQRDGDHDCVSSVMVNSGVHCGPSGVDPNSLCLCHSFLLLSSFLGRLHLLASASYYFYSTSKKGFPSLTFFFLSSHLAPSCFRPPPFPSPLQVSFPLRAASASGSGAGSLSGSLQLHCGPQVLCAQPLRRHYWPA